MPSLPTVTLTPAAGCNCAACPFYTGNPDAPEPVCSGRNTSCSWCGCSVRNTHLPRGPVDSTPCATCAVRCGSRSDISGWMGDIGGTVTFDDIRLSRWPWDERLPTFVPLLDSSASATKMGQRFAWPAYGVPLRRVISRTPGRSGELALQPRWERDGAHACLDLDPHRQAAVLVGYAPDATLERFWQRRHADGLIERIAAMGFDLVTTPDFSVFADQPRSEHLLNMRRTLVVADELDTAGVRTAPTVYAYRLEDLRRWRDWIVDTEPPLIFTPKHTLRGNEEWRRWAEPHLRYLAGELDAAGVTTRVLVSGVSSAQRVADLRRWLGDRLVLASQQPLQLAMQGRLATDRSRTTHDAHRADLFAANVRRYDRAARGQR